MKTIPYQITVHWSNQDASYEASVPALRGCLAYGDTAEAAVQEVLVAAELWLEAAEKHNKVIPAPSAGLERLMSLAPVLNMAAVARRSNVSPQTLASKMQHGRALSQKEQESIGATLSGYGIPAAGS